MLLHTQLADLLCVLFLGRRLVYFYQMFKDQTWCKEDDVPVELAENLKTQ